MSLPRGAMTTQLNNREVMKTPFVVFQAHHDDYYNMSRKSLDNVHDETILSKVFFHPKNVDLIQKQIILQIFYRTNGEYLIEHQNELDLRIVMQSVFMKYAKHLPNNIQEQIRELDNLVVDEVIPDIISQIQAHFGYIAQVFGPTYIMDHPVNVSKSGRKTLPSVTRTYDPDSR